MALPSELFAAVAARRKVVEETAEVVDGVGLGIGGGTGLDDMKFSGYNFRSVKSECGFVGLENQGATCYLNSLIQTLYMTPEFRRALYKWQYNPDIHGEEKRCVPYQLQRLFARLQLSPEGAIPTYELTKSFGFGSGDAFVQQDVVECMTILFDFITQLAGGTDIATHIAQEQTGLLGNVIRFAVNGVEIERNRTEAFGVLPVPIAGHSTLQEALIAVTTPEQLSGSNQYFSEDAGGYVDALKGIRLDRVPKIFTMQLGRFAFDYDTFSRYKVSSPLSFPLTLDVAPYTGKPTVEVGPDSTLYELFSIMIHTGGAHSGHYFAYIQDVTTHKWYSFNDAHIREIPLDQVLYAAGVKDREGKDDTDVARSTHEDDSKPFQAVNATSNAYMLVYRQTTGLPVPPYASSELPTTLREEMEGFRERFNALKTEWQREVDTRGIKVLHKGQVKLVRIHKDTPIRSLLEDGRAAHGLEYPLDQLRLREYNVLKGLALAPMENLDLTPQMLGMTNLQSVVLESREAAESFPEWIEGGFQLFVSLLRPNEDVYDPPIQIAIAGDPTVAALRVAACSALNIHGAIRMVVLKEEMAVELDGDDKNLRHNYNLDIGTTVRVEEWDGTSPSRVVALFDRLINSTDVQYNAINADTAEGEAAAALAPLELMQFDQRRPLAELKQALAEKIGLPVSEFRLLKELPGGPELKDLTKPLMFFGLTGTGGSVRLARGRPLEPHEFRVQVFLHVPAVVTPTVATPGDSTDSPVATPSSVDSDSSAAAAAEQFEQVGNVILDRATTGTGAKDAILAAISDNRLPPVTLMRLREKAGARMGGVWVDTKPLFEFLQPLRDDKAVVIQRTLTPEVFTEEHILLSVRRWFPTAKLLSDPVDMAFDRNSTIDATKAAICSAFPPDVAPEHIMIIKPFAFHLKDLSGIPKLKWDPQPPGSSSLDQCRMRFKSGDTLMYKDSNDEEAWKPAKPSESAASSAANTPEARFRILTPEQQVAREAALAAEQEAQRKVLEEQLGAARAAAAIADNDAGGASAQRVGPAPETIEKFRRLLHAGVPQEVVYARMAAENVRPEDLIRE